MLLAIILALVALVAVAAIIVVRSRPRQDEGMEKFRRHIDALSPESRREVHDRVKRQEDER